ncbi:phosphonate C-P lyase system protein PhnH [Ancylobacter terrae]|uniref:phosphonate C-P lyase system protein PhnH n=1 Tax=Ancylobacter sp. sgz301288 TaxID=3342077 RepID=UPI00385BF27F
MPDQSLALGFAEPVRDAQAAFRAAMWALARPGRSRPVAADLQPPAPLSPVAAALVLALADFETPLWLDPMLAGVPEVARFLRFHTGAPIVAEPELAAFAVIADAAKLPDFNIFSRGTPDYPDRSATLIVQVERFTGQGMVLEGPGIQGAIAFGATPLPADFINRIKANRASFPLGVDLLLAGPDAVAGLPRSVRAREG